MNMEKSSSAVRHVGLLLCLVLFCLFCIPKVGHADEVGIPISTDSELMTFLEDDSQGSYYLKNDVGITRPLLIRANKSLDLNNHKITANTGKTYKTSGSFQLTNASDFTSFIIKNGELEGGYGSGLGVVSNKTGIIYAEEKAYDLTITVQDIKHEGHGFFKGSSSDIIFKGDIELNNKGFNVRALNIRMYGNPDDPNDPENTYFVGHADTGTVGSNAYATGNGGVNISFDGYDVNSTKTVGKMTKQLLVDKNAVVKLENLTLTNTGYTNNVGNFSVMEIDGTFEGKAYDSSLRTTAAQRSITSAGTDSGQSEINVNPGSHFSILTSNERSTHGVIYTYNVDININNPSTFNIRSFAGHQFFHGWKSGSGRQHNNFRIYNADIAVWEKAAKGIGNPINYWQDVEVLTVENFHSSSGGTGVISSSHVGINADVFKINDYSRISNDLRMPELIADDAFQVDKDNKKYQIDNNIAETDSIKFKGYMTYLLPSTKEDVGLPLDSEKVGGDLTLKFTDSVEEYTTEIKKDGTWEFENIDFRKHRGGALAKLKLVDLDKRTSEKEVEILDKQPPKGDAVLVKIELNDETFINKPRESVKNAKDETTSELFINYKDTIDSLKQKAKELGLKELPVIIKDEAGNQKVIASQLLVTDDLGKTGLVIGQDFEFSIMEWDKLTTDERREKIIEYGQVKGWKIEENMATEVTNDEKLLTVNYGEGPFEAGNIYDVTLTVGNYKKIIKMTLSGGELSLTGPSSIDFDTLTYQAKDYRMDTPTIDQSLVVSDMRSSQSVGWRLYISQVTPMTLVGEDGTLDTEHVLPKALKYKLKDEEITLKSESSEIYAHEPGGIKEVKIIDKEVSNEDSVGVKFALKSSEKPEVGHYRGLIRWTLVEAY